jgi:hypothetical protein
MMDICFQISSVISSGESHDGHMSSDIKRDLSGGILCKGPCDPRERESVFSERSKRDLQRENLVSRERERESVSSERSKCDLQ